MNGFEILLTPPRTEIATSRPSKGRVISLHAVNGGRSEPKPTREDREAIDIVVGGVNLTARVDADQAPCVIRDLALAIVDLACGVRRRAIVRFYDAPWEIGLERIGVELAISVVRNGPDGREGVEVAVHDRRTSMSDAIAGTRAAIDAMLGAPSALASVLESELSTARDALASLADVSADALPEEVIAIAEPEASSRCGFGVELPLRVTTTLENDGVRAPSETSDLHSLLGRGRLRAVVRGRSEDLGEVHGFLVAERVLELGRQVLEAWERGKSLHARISLSSTGAVGREAGSMSVRLEPEGALVLAVVAIDKQTASVFPALEGPDFVDGAVALARQLVRAVVRRDRGQTGNLRVQSLRRKVRDLSERLRDVARPVGPFGESDLVNARRESYAPYLQRAPSIARAVPRAKISASVGAGKMRFEPRWTAEVPGIDLRATFLCGDRLILSGVTQTACVDRVDGRTLWKAPTVRATSLPTAGGLARLRGDGKLELRDFGDGSVIWSTDCAPRSRGTPAACTLVAPGLPRLIIATDGDRHLVAFDLTSGAPRWRYAMTRPGPIRIRRAGRLLIVSSDESQLCALDAVDGSVVWRLRDRLRFAAPAAIEREDLFAIAGEPGGLARLHMVDVLSGARRYERAMEASVAIDAAPMLIGTVALILTRDRRGIGLVAIDRATGVERWNATPGTWPTGTSPLAVDGLLVLNLPTGEVVGIAADSGETIWRHVFEAPVSGDAPRKLEPVLRSGALFVPQDKVRVLRPADGAIVGVVPSDLVPDLLRVDERCDVYVAEESGHVAAFAASARLEVVSGGPRLSVVRT